MHVYGILLVCLSAAAAVPRNPERIAGGVLTTINIYPYAGVVLYGFGTYFTQDGAGTVLNARSMLTAASCISGDPNNRQIRVGSSFASSGGTVHQVRQIITHNLYDPYTYDHDIAIVRVATLFINSAVSPASIAGQGYNLPPNSIVWAIGWGNIASGNSERSEQLRHVQMWLANHPTCVQNYATIGILVTSNMLCAGWLNVGVRDQCYGDVGGPLIHNNIVVGVCSWRGLECARPLYPGLNTNLMNYASWLQINA